MKAFIASLLVVGALSGGLTLGITNLGVTSIAPETVAEPDAMEETKKPMASGIVTSDIIAVPIIANDQVHSYLIGKFSVETNADQAASFGPLLKPLIQDVLVRALNERAADIDNRVAYTVYEEISEWLLVRINKALAQNVAKAIFVTQLDIIASESVRTPREAL